VEYWTYIIREGLMPQKAYKFEKEIGPGGKLDLTIPVPEGTRVEVLILAPVPDEFEDLQSAAVSSTEFWDNTYDDEDWNNA
jgi:hypothetical protein